MNFLKRHYEKLLLVLMLIIFLVTLFYQVDIITGADKIKPEDLELPPMHADYENVKFSKAEFKNKDIFLKDTAWLPTSPRNPKIKVYTDLMLNFKSARCPNPKCSRIVPLYYFYNKPHKCPICNYSLPTPNKTLPPTTPSVEGGTVSKGDTDGDGIPDRIEAQWGTNPNKSDSQIDSDGDGFANIYEFKNGTRGDRPRNHPPLYQRLYIQDVRRTLLDFKFKKITATGTDKNDWDVQVNVRYKGRTKSKFLVIGDTIDINNKKYELVDIKLIKKKSREKSVKVDKDISEITLRSLKGDDTIVAVRNEDVYSSKPQAIMIDELDGKEYAVDQGAILTIGSPQTGREKYKVLKVDPGKEEVILTNLKKLHNMPKGSKRKVTKDLLIPKIRKEVEQSNEGMGIDGMPGDPGMMDPGRAPGRTGRGTRIRRTRNRTNPGIPMI